MRSGTSFFNVTVWKKTVLRFWPIWAVGLVFWVLALPAQGMMALQRQLENGGDWLLSFSASVDGLGGDTALSFAVVFGLLAAMAVCSHLYSSRRPTSWAHCPSGGRGSLSAITPRGCLCCCCLI